jgi:DeoR/GlpR family transcriptional regulator of sugar metabolism
VAHIPRHDEILTIVSHLRSVTVQELTERLRVSEVTIRKDLALLEERGNILRTRGGARLAEDRALLRTIQIRRGERRAGKERIAAKAKEFVSEDDTMYLDSGSTCALFAGTLVDMNLRVVTNSLDAMNILANAPGISLLSTGGSYRKEAGSFIGPLAMGTLSGFRFGSCFVGTTGISPSGTFSSQNIVEAELKARALKASRRRIILADSAKFGRDAFAVFARPGEVDILITDTWVDGMEAMRALGIEVIVAEPLPHGGRRR